jgi:hypothetical protein
LGIESRTSRTAFSCQAMFSASWEQSRLPT